GSSGPPSSSPSSTAPPIAERGTRPSANTGRPGRPGTSPPAPRRPTSETSRSAPTRNCAATGRTAWPRSTGTSPRWRSARRRAEVPAEYTDSAYPLQYYFEARSGAGVTLWPGFKSDFLGQPYFVVQPQGALGLALQAARGDVDPVVADVQLPAVKTSLL